MPPETKPTEAATALETPATVAAPAPAKIKTVAKAKTKIAKKKVAAPAPAKKARRSKECIAHTHGYHACNCGGNYCGSNVTG